MVEEAFQLIPAANVDVLWSDRVLFMSKLGQVRPSVIVAKYTAPSSTCKHALVHPAGSLCACWSHNRPNTITRGCFLQDVKQLLNQLRAKEPTVQAKAWASLAASSALPGDQLEALTTAVTLLDGMFAQAGARIDLGEWLYLNRFPTEVGMWRL